MSEAFTPLTPDWPLAVAPPAARSPYAYKLDTGVLGMASPVTGPLGIDLEKKTADFVISTTSKDRGGDVMEVDGCDLSEYARNPIVLFGHRQAMPGAAEASKPIGVAVAPDGRLTVWKDGGRLLARVHFHEDTAEARECWLGVKNGWLRGASIGFDPIDPPIPLPPEPGQTRLGYRFTRWKLLEFSVVVIPMNADCVRIKGYLDENGKSLTPTFRKALAFAAEVPAPSIEALIMKALSPLKPTLDLLAAKIKVGELTMTSKAFPPKKPEKKPAEDAGAEKPDEGTPPPNKPDAGQPDRHADGPDLAATIASLTTAIVQLQEMVQPKEAPAAETPPPAPHQEPDADDVPGAGPEANDEDADDQPAVIGKPPADDPEKLRQEEEQARPARQAYQRGGQPQKVKGYMRKEHLSCMKEAADHLEELSGMERGTKWTGSHAMACKAHCAAIRKAMDESSMASGGATEGGDQSGMDDSAAKSMAAEVVKEALGPIHEQVFRLTGKRVG